MKAVTAVACDILGNEVVGVGQGLGVWVGGLDVCHLVTNLKWQTSVCTDHFISSQVRGVSGRVQIVFGCVMAH